jgi:murE/murF fusion protein
MISLGQLISSIPAFELQGLSGTRRLVKGLTSDSRTVEPGYVFVALQGEKVNGLKYVGEAVDRGCLAVVVEDESGLSGKIPLVKVPDSHRAYGFMAAEYFGHPARYMKIIGLTGTNGKTTTSWIVEQVIKAGGGRPGVIGTVNYRYPGGGGETVELDAPLTTPEPMMLQGLLREMSDAGVTHAILEVSSHSLAQQRLAGILFDVAVFTNLSRDHLDYHENMEAYFGAKQKLFEEYLKPSGIAVVVVESGEIRKPARSDWGKILVDRLSGIGFRPYPVKGKKRSFITCGFGENCIVQASKLKQDVDGLVCTISHAGKRMQVQSGLIGRYNISNMVAATATGIALGMDHKNVLQGLQEVDRIPGRLERVMLPRPEGAESGPRVFVDYAHTPDALENVLGTLRTVTPGRLFCIVGCGGDRDRGKRPMMGAVAGDIADGVLVTSDNPRGENPEVILSEIEKGLVEAGLQKVGLDDFFALKKPLQGYAIMKDRRQAIHQVCSRAENSDVILIAGKGHETYQITAAGKHFFDDRIEARSGSMRWTVDHLLEATSGQLKQRGKDILLGRISTDTRTLKPGDVFVALTGENFDGHDYIEAAIRKGVAAVIVEKNCTGLSRKISVIKVADTLKSLGDIAHYRRLLLAPDVKVIGITGSSGKTTVKDMTASIFDTEFDRNPGQPVLKTQGNLNNLIGLPLSLLNIDGGHRVAVMEMGMNRPGEIKRLARIADPEIGCITNVQAAHLEGLGSIEGVARAKGELFAAMSDQGIRIINCDDPHVRKLGVGYGNNVIGFAVTPIGRRCKPAVRATRINSLGEAGMRFTLHVNKWQKRFTIPATGTHNVANCAAAAAIATAAGVAPEIIARGLARYSSGDKRLQIVDLPGGIHVVNDSYNANPASMAAALRTVIGFGRKCRRVALLGDMFELGEGAVEAHSGVGALVAELGFDYLGVTGEFAAAVAKMASLSGMKKSRIKICKDKEVMTEWIAGLVAGKKIGRSDWLLIKGSRGMRMEQVQHSLVQRLTSDKN